MTGRLADMLLKEILDTGAENSTGNVPDALVRRSVLAALLVRAGLLDDTAQALNAFRAWTHPEVRAQFDPQTFVERFRATDDNVVHE